MKVELDAAPAGTLLVQSYREGAVVINGRKLHPPLIVTPDRLLADWAPANAGVLQPADLEPIRSLGVSTVLLGTGTVSCFPSPGVLAYLQEAGIGHETMNTAAACRSYNVLAAEGRRVAAVLLAVP